MWPQQVCLHRLWSLGPSTLYFGLMQTFAAVSVVSPHLLVQFPGSEMPPCFPAPHPQARGSSRPPEGSCAPDLSLRVFWELDDSAATLALWVPARHPVTQYTINQGSLFCSSLSTLSSSENTFGFIVSVCNSIQQKCPGCYAAGTGLAHFQLSLHLRSWLFTG